MAETTSQMTQSCDKLSITGQRPPSPVRKHGIFDMATSNHGRNVLPACTIPVLVSTPAKSELLEEVPKIAQCFRKFLYLILFFSCLSTSPRKRIAKLSQRPHRDDIVSSFHSAPLTSSKMSYHYSNKDSQHSRKRGLSLSDDDPAIQSSPRCDSPIGYDNYWDYQAKRSNKRRRTGKDTKELQGSESSRKIQVTEEVWKQESARYGIIPAAGRQTIRGIEHTLRTIACLTVLQIEAICQAILVRISGRMDDEPLAPDDARKHSQLNRATDSHASGSSSVGSRPPSQSPLLSPPRQQSLSNAAENIQECPTCTLHQPTTAISCEVCGSLLLCSTLR